MITPRGTERGYVGGYHENLPPPNVPKPPTTKEKREATEHFLVMLSRCINPQTGKIYTTEELSAIFKLKPRVIGKKLRTHGIFQNPMPVVRQDQLPDNEQAFFTGLKLGNFQTERIPWGSRAFIVIATESENQQRRDLLKETIGTWGEIHDNADGMRIYVHSPAFDFMTGSSVEARMLDTKTRFAPFLLGLTTARLSERKSRISLKDTKLLERIHTRFERYFDFSMGRFEIEHRNGLGRDIGVVTLKDPGRVLGSLMGLESVCTLPFFRNLAQLYD